MLAPLSLFVSSYLATFAALALGHLVPRYWIALASASVATALTIAVVERGRWTVGLAAPPLTTLRELALGAVIAALIILATDALIVSSTNLRHVRGGGFPWGQLLVVFVPAAIHEELLFRGYLFQRLRRWSRGAAISISAVLFALLHAGNTGATPLAVANLALAGVLLALGYELFERLLVPIGMHLAWNVLSGPLLGYQVSGYGGEVTILALRGSGPDWLTGGSFGMEGSLWIGVMETIAVVGLALELRRCKMRRAAE